MWGCTSIDDDRVDVSPKPSRRHPARHVRLDGLIDADIEPRRSYRDATTSEILADWHWLSVLLNRINHAMGRSDLYPFTITEPVRTKLDSVHRVVQDVAGRTAGQPVLACPPRAHS